MVCSCFDVSSLVFPFVLSVLVCSQLHGIHLRLFRTYRVGRTSNCFRGALTGIAFGLGFGPCGMFRGKGGSTSISGRESVAYPVGTAGICNQMPSRKLWALVR